MMLIVVRLFRLVRMGIFEKFSVKKLIDVVIEVMMIGILFRLIVCVSVFCFERFFCIC